MSARKRKQVLPSVNGDLQSKSKKLKLKVEPDQSLEETIDATSFLDDIISIHEDESELGGKGKGRKRHAIDFGDWEVEDLVTLVESVEREAPKADSGKYSTALEKINWNNVQFGSRSSEDCKKTMTSLLQQVRRYRTLQEVLVDAKMIAKNPYRSQRTGRVSHPDMPKKPMTPYFRFFSEKRAKYKEANPDMNPTELSRFMASVYAQLSEKKRARYRRRYDAEMAEYREKYEQFRKEHADLFRKVTKAAKQPKPPTGPEKPKKPFHFYSASRLKKYEGEDHKSAMEKIKESWKNLDETKRMKWIRKSLRDRKRYQAELAAFVEENPHFVPPKIKPLLSKSEQKLKDKVDGRPERPPTSGYILYSRIMMSELTDVPSKEKVVIIAKRWKELSDEERAKYAAKAQKSQAKYVEKFDTYLQHLPDDEKEKVLSEQKLKLPSEKKLKRKKRAAHRKIILNSALTCFQTEELMRMQREHPDKLKGELIASINKRWEEMPQEEKQPYLDMAESIKDYMPGNEGKKKEKRKRGINANPILPEFLKKSGQKKPPSNGFTLFVHEMATEYKGLRPTEKMQKVAQLWKKMSETERKEYATRSKEQNEIFAKMVKQYEESGQLPENAKSSTAERAKSPLKSAFNSEPSTQPTSSSKIKAESLEKIGHNKFLYQESSDDSNSS